MANILMDTPTATPNSHELTCINCGKKFIFRRHEQERFASRGWILPKNCMECNKAARELQEKEQEKQENQRWQQKKKRRK